MAHEALMVKRWAGSLSYPRKEPVDRRNVILPSIVPTTFAVGASLVTEDDFELDGDFADVCSRAGERIVGFLQGSGVVVAAWLLWVVLASP